jgi:hypothetical protein
MNIVDLIKNELTGDVLGKLSSMVGESEDKTKTAVAAAVPGMLSILANLASTSSGSDKVINALKQVDPGTQGSFGDILSGPAAPKVQEKGGGLLDSLLGGGSLAAILGILSKFAGIDANSIKRLLSTLAPLVLSMIAKQMSGKQLTSQVLSSFFAEQKSNIASALPAGLSFADVPGLSAGVSRAAGAVREEISGLPNWLLPLAGLVLLGALAWYFLGGQPAVEEKPADAGQVPVVKRQTLKPKVEVALPDVGKFSTDLGDIYTSLSTLLGNVKDAPAAESALPKLTDVAAKIDGLRELWDKLPDAGKTTVSKVTTDHLSKLKELVAKVLAIAGVSEKFKTTVNGLITALEAFTAK